LIFGSFAFQELIFFGLLLFNNKAKDKKRSANEMPDIKIQNYLTYANKRMIILRPSLSAT